MALTGKGVADVVCGTRLGKGAGLYATGHSTRNIVNSLSQQINDVDAEFESCSRRASVVGSGNAGRCYDGYPLKNGK